MNDNSYAQAAQVGGASTMSFVLGAVIGASIALLLAPENGAQTRTRLADAAKRVGQRVRHTTDELAHDARDAMEAGRQEFGKTRSSV